MLCGQHHFPVRGWLHFAWNLACCRKLNAATAWPLNAKLFGSPHAKAAVTASLATMAAPCSKGGAAPGSGPRSAQPAALGTASAPTAAHYALLLRLRLGRLRLRPAQWLGRSHEAVGAAPAALYA
eukprot:gnl/TRDRNA2_/TRDRNA2_172236_c1_seq1.p2 gnl/TRDRNA2_/TRDRNA2_172236_c1~~gnl/TRDRNA2_/TRDRNA2_172236_c1_seq1.p2  ORF type:complete len:125 (+),score=8.25 gnl/TRDRNA2_/TRDRNA2_172236_c1_seq1:205-579(+)